MRVLIVTRNFPPERGGIQRLMHRLTLELAREFEVAVIAPRGCAAILTPPTVAFEVRGKPLWRFFVSTLLRCMTVAPRFRPDAVIAGSGLVAPFAWLAAKLARSRLIVYVYGLDLVVDHWIYRTFWHPFVRRADLCIAVSRNTALLAENIGVARAKIRIVHPGVDVAVSGAVPGNFRERFGLGDSPVLLSVGRLIARKGLLEFVESALPAILAGNSDSCLVVLGDEAPDLLNGSSIGLGECIRRRAAQLGIAHHVRFIGPQDDATLAAAYRAADVHVFPVREVAGDMEGFGMVAVEAAAHGLPTVAFAVGGVPDAVEDDVSGYLVAPGDYDAFASKVAGLLRQRPNTNLRERAQVFARRFSWETIGMQARTAVSDVVAGNPRWNESP